MSRLRVAEAVVKLWRAWLAVGRASPLWLRKAVRVAPVVKAVVK